MLAAGFWRRGLSNAHHSQTFSTDTTNISVKCTIVHSNKNTKTEISSAFFVLFLLFHKLVALARSLLVKHKSLLLFFHFAHSFFPKDVKNMLGIRYFYWFIYLFIYSSIYLFIYYLFIFHHCNETFFVGISPRTVTWHHFQTINMIMLWCHNINGIWLWVYLLRVLEYTICAFHVLNTRPSLSRTPNPLPPPLYLSHAP